jgi:hypothetical protein
MTKYGIPHLSGKYLQVTELNTNKKAMLSRLIWEEFNGPIADGMVVDHINSNTLDNRIENLQLLTNMQNRHRSSRGSVQKRGTINWSRPWRANRTINGKYHEQHFGTPCGAMMFNNTRSLV